MIQFKPKANESSDANDEKAAKEEKVINSTNPWESKKKDPRAFLLGAFHSSGAANPRNRKTGNMI